MSLALWPIVAFVLAGAQAAPGKLVEGVACPSDPAQTYSIYLPSNYETTRRWPLLIVFDPGGRGPRAAEVFRAAAERYGWIVAASETSRNGPWEPTLRAVNAMWPALLGGYAVDVRRVYTAGHSGGATVAWMIAQQTGQVAGVITSGQPYPGPEDGKRPGFAWFGTAGHADFNFIEVKGIDARLARSHATHRMEFFDGAHQWLPADLTFRALGWLELLAMKDGRRPRDAELAAEVYAGDMARARAAEDNGRLIEAWQSYDSLAASYSGILDVGEAEARRKIVESDARYKAMRKIEERADSRERNETNTVARMFSRLPVEDLPPLQELRRRLHLDSLDKAARGDSYDAASARRSIALIRVQLSSLIRELRQKGDARTAMLQRLVDSMQ
jgi:dienelactone hydrolase